MTEDWKAYVIYQIYPRSFQDDRGEGIGTLAGITRRLPHVAGLGVDAIWISPFFTSPQADMGYDISDNCGVDPIFGTLQDFDALVARAHDLGLKVIIDQVPSHTSDRHIWFMDSRTSRKSAKSDWYVWADAKPDGTAPNNWLSVFGGPAWTWDSRRRQYYMHSFLPSQPQLNFHNPDVVAAVLDGMAFWLDRGIDGFRLDSINYPFHDRHLRDNPPKRGETPEKWANPYDVQDHLHDKTQPETVGFLRRVRALLDRHGAFSVGEVGEGMGANRIMGEYTRGGDRLHMAYSFEMLGDDFSPAHIRTCVEGFFAEAPDGWPSWAFSNHDVIRHATRWTPPGGASDAVARLAAAVLMSLRGSVCLYQGEELGQTQTELAFEEILDPPGLKFWPDYKGRDGSRTPMVWEADAAHGGFTTGTPWLPVKPPQMARAVDLQSADADSVLAFYRAMLAFRGATPVLRQGDIVFHDAPDRVLTFTRGDGPGAVRCAFNLGGHPVTVPISRAGTLTGPYRGATLAAKSLTLAPWGFGWVA